MDTLSRASATGPRFRTRADLDRDFNLSSFSGSATNGLPIFAHVSANPHFRSEQLDGYELDYLDLGWPPFYVDIAGFYNHYRDLSSEDILGGLATETKPPPAHYLYAAQFGNGLVGSTTGMAVASDALVAAGRFVLFPRHACEERHGLNRHR